LSYAEKQGAGIPKIILKKMYKGEFILPVFKIHYKASAIKLVWSQWEDRHTLQWDRTENPEIDPHNVQLTHSKGANTFQ